MQPINYINFIHIKTIFKSMRKINSNFKCNVFIFLGISS